MADITYTGWKKWTPTSEDWVELYANGTVPVQLKENEYLIVKCNNNGIEHSLVTRLTGKIRNKNN